jgi:hypothetical protein
MIFEAQLADPTPERERATLADCVEQAVARGRRLRPGLAARGEHSRRPEFDRHL